MTTILDRGALILGGGFALALLATALAYWPGLGGPFLLDDYPNLHGLAAVHEQPGISSWLQYVLGGSSSTLGRPLAHLSFAAQHASWPSDPAAFLRVNLLLHLLNGVLCFAAVSRLQRLGVLAPAAWLAPGVTALWLLLPLHGSAVLYVVQRMTLLAAGGTLAALLLWLIGRERARDGAPGAGYGWMAAGLATALGPGVLSKESAALTPALLLVVELTLLRTLPAPRHWRVAQALLLWLPCAALGVYLAVSLPGFLAGYEYRTFTLGERLLTEPRALAIYATGLLPSFDGFRFFFDDLPISTSLLQPWTTLVALALWLGLLIAGMALRHRAPGLLFAVGWFLVGHLLESTVPPLEIAFEHRNYIPALGPVLALGAGLAALLRSATTARWRSVLAALALGYVLLHGLDTRLAAQQWGRPFEQARAWVLLQPHSLRAVYHYADLLGQREPAAALEVHRRARQRWPGDAATALSVAVLECNAQRTDDPAAIATLMAGYDGRALARVGSLVATLADRVATQRCSNLAPTQALAVVDAALGSRWLATQAPLLHSAAAHLAHAAENLEVALARLDQALAQDVQVPLLQHAVVWSLEGGDVQRARAYLEVAENGPRLGARDRLTHKDEIRGLRQLIELFESLHAATPD